jgi:hypothetical protein
LTRNHSYDQNAISAKRPELPRSRSAVYLQKHRRSPSLANNSALATFENVASTPPDAAAAAAEPFLVHDALSPAAEVMLTSPVDIKGPDTEEERGRRIQIQNLKETLQESMVILKRGSSPTRATMVMAEIPQQSNGSALKASAPALTPEALKIAHSRSSSEIQLAPSQSQSPSSHTSPGDSDEDGLEMRRVPMLRKKSGELVKPALRGNSRRRPSSAPGTPTHPKAVHFNDNIEQVRHFLQVDRPMAVSAGSSPVEIYDSESDYPFSSDDTAQRVLGWEIRLAKFPKESFERSVLPVRVEKLSLSKDNKSLVGIVAVANIAFQKLVVVRFTLDYWKTTSEISAEFYNQATKEQLADGYDRFQFSIKLSEQANLQNKTMYLCVRYTTNGQEHWDNNFGNNYQIDFVRKLINKTWSKTPPGVNVIPRSRQTANGNRLPRPKSFPAGATTSDDEFTSSFDTPFRIQTSGSGQGNKKPNAERDPQNAPGQSRLSNRYDFNTSLHAALVTAHSALGDKSGLKLKTSHTKRPVEPAPPQLPVQPISVQPVVVPAANLLARPDLNSAEYKDLIKKFCYFGSGGNTALVSPESEEPIAKGLNIQTDPPAEKETTSPKAQNADSSGSNDSTPTSSASNSPPTPRVQLHVTENHSDALSVSSSASSTRSTRTVSPRLLPYRSPSPAVNSAYQEFPHQGLSVQSAQC